MTFPFHRWASSGSSWPRAPAQVSCEDSVILGTSLEHLCPGPMVVVGGCCSRWTLIPGADIARTLGRRKELLACGGCQPLSPAPSWPSIRARHPACLPASLSHLSAEASCTSEVPPLWPGVPQRLLPSPGQGGGCRGARGSAGVCGTQVLSHSAWRAAFILGSCWTPLKFCP